jgi:hypothetical protein
VQAFALERQILCPSTVLPCEMMPECQPHRADLVAVTWRTRLGQFLLDQFSGFESLLPLFGREKLRLEKMMRSARGARDPLTFRPMYLD